MLALLFRSHVLESRSWLFSHSSRPVSTCCIVARCLCHFGLLSELLVNLLVTLSYASLALLRALGFDELIFVAVLVSPRATRHGASLPASPRPSHVSRPATLLFLVVRCVRHQPSLSPLRNPGTLHVLHMLPHLQVCPPLSQRCNDVELSVNTHLYVLHCESLTELLDHALTESSIVLSSNNSIAVGGLLVLQRRSHSLPARCAWRSLLSPALSWKTIPSTGITSSGLIVSEE